MPVRWLISRFHVVRSSNENSFMPMAAGSRHDLHQLGSGPEEVAQPLGGFVDDQPGAEVWLLRRDADRAVVGVADARRWRGFDGIPEPLLGVRGPAR